MSFNFKAAVTICSDFGAPKYSLSLFHLFPHLFAIAYVYIWLAEIPMIFRKDALVISTSSVLFYVAYGF